LLRDFFYFFVGWVGWRTEAEKYQKQNVDCPWALL